MMWSTKAHNSSCQNYFSGFPQFIAAYSPKLLKTIHISTTTLDQHSGTRQESRSLLQRGDPASNVQQARLWLKRRNKSMHEAHTASFLAPLYLFEKGSSNFIPPKWLMQKPKRLGMQTKTRDFPQLLLCRRSALLSCSSLNTWFEVEALRPFPQIIGSWINAVFKQQEAKI